ncbi:MAG: tetratricopeptide repeat protein [Candidatus Aminicenantes bacterium]|nr:tetratricopeptide repeat protein [Candidatus Aminicenantes bacterium]NIM82096.1 tetratricopeptide repeat protein [Candidatus Aminicenantes bacterium]NIN21490.1 tetratricopeptide repeat protein [Candidatus Aminicenantes bacterium]NIN45302.1 tetratricopeptide repeat protein [Candidatus Aminicenantes bacterium]NIN88119.1 tetratricopeptide repeat protein [Candidatus Aminicenantes bacterium]
MCKLFFDWSLFFQWSMELLQELELKELKEEYRWLVHHRIGILFGDFFGEYEKALNHYNKALEINEKIDNIKGVSYSLHQIGTIYQDKGDYDAALTHYQKAMDIKEKIGDIAGTASSMAQMGKVLSIKGQHNDALKLCLQSYLIFVKLESPNVTIVEGFIRNIRENLPEDQFNAILKEFNLTSSF